MEHFIIYNFLNNLFIFINKILTKIFLYKYVNIIDNLLFCAIYTKNQLYMTQFIINLKGKFD
jgi:hypothetical protein